MQKAAGSNSVALDLASTCSATNVDKLVRDTVLRIDDVSKRTGSFFAKETEGVSSDTYLSLLEGANLQDLRGTTNLERSGNLILFNHTMSASTKLIIAFAVVLSILIIVCAIFTALMLKGTINIPGVDPEMALRIAKYIGASLVATIAAYSMLGLGHLGGYRAGCHNNNEEKAETILALGNSRLRVAAKAQKEVWDNLTKSHSELQCYASELMHLVDMSCRRSAACLSELNALRSSSEEKNVKLTKRDEKILTKEAGITEENKKVFEENEDIIGDIKSRLDNINKKLRVPLSTTQKR